MTIKFHQDDGGRETAGFKGDAGDCVVRSIAIATGTSYLEVYEKLWELTRATKLIRDRGASPRNGVKRKIYDAYLKALGWRFTPCMSIGSGCKVHLRSEELPAGRLIVRLSGHLAAVIDGVLHDTYECSRNGTRCVYGYYSKEAT